MISAINSSEHAKHTEGFIEALRDRQVTYKCDPSPMIKRKFIFIVAKTFYQAKQLAVLNGLLDYHWAYCTSGERLLGLKADMVSVWLGPEHTKHPDWERIEIQCVTREIEQIYKN